VRAIRCQSCASSKPGAPGNIYRKKLHGSQRSSRHHPAEVYWHAGQTRTEAETELKLLQPAARALFISACMAAASAWAQFSPGALSKAHSSLASPTQCVSCHAVASGTRRLKCLHCHTEIRERLAAKRGWHPVLVKGKDQQECARCHSEHNGVGFVPVRWDVTLEEFDHRQTGYALEGGHRRLECRKCHAPEKVLAGERGKIRMKDMRRSYLGLSQECASCHRDEHRGQVSAHCEKCHGFDKWKPANRFDHAGANYPLAGAHSKTPCLKCHPPVEQEKPFIKYVGLSFPGCAPCHKDVHRGAFTASCDRCHVPDAWKPARMAESRFDHSTTKYPLAGKHVPLACNKCHPSTNYKERVAHQSCVDCHRKDPHKGQFQARADRGECGACHNVDGWKPSTYVAARHRESRYPLEGRHLPVPCAKCHKPAGADTDYRIRYGQCTDCHDDAHQKQFAAAPYTNRCQECHTVNGFRPSTFTVARHAKGRFPLEAAHVAVACIECHKMPPGERVPAAVRFVFAARACKDCHEDPHGHLSAPRIFAVSGAAAQEPGCQDCHTLRSWRDMSRFDHARTTYPLTGAHGAVKCTECHRPPLGLKRITFRGAPTACSGCHEDIHANQFSMNGSTADCAACHRTGRWKPAVIDHDKARFALKGVHRDVPCAQCHKQKQEINGKLAILYKATPHDCISCHPPAIVD
jgi:hypothetical protein